MRLNHEEKKTIRLEFCESCATACDAVCIAEAERDRIFQRLLVSGLRLA